MRVCAQLRPAGRAVCRLGKTGVCAAVFSPVVPLRRRLRQTVYQNTLCGKEAGKFEPGLFFAKVIKSRSRVAQWQSVRLLIGWSLVRIQPREPDFSRASARFFAAQRTPCPHTAFLLPFVCGCSAASPLINGVCMFNIILVFTPQMKECA